MQTIGQSREQTIPVLDVPVGARQGLPLQLLRQHGHPDAGQITGIRVLEFEPIEELHARVRCVQKGEGHFGRVAWLEFGGHEAHDVPWAQVEGIVLEDVVQACFEKNKSIVFILFGVQRAKGILKGANDFRLSWNGGRRGMRKVGLLGWSNNNY